MELAFETKQLRSWCEDPEHAKCPFKPEVKEQLKNRLADLTAANSPLDLIAGTPRFFNSHPPRISLALGSSHALNCVVNHSSPKLDDDGHVIWETVRRLRITSIKEVVI
jgi:hypothetical protein